MRWSAVLLPYLATLIGLEWVGNAWLAIGLYHLGILFLLILKAPFDRRLIFSGDGGRWLPLFVIACALAGPIFLLLWPMVVKPGGELALILAEMRLSGLSWFLFIPYFALIHPLLEEILWRALLPNGSSKHLHWTDLAFAGYHLLVLKHFLAWPWALVSFAVLVLTAWSWRRWTEFAGGLRPALISHVVADLSIVIAAAWLAR